MSSDLHFHLFYVLKLDKSSTGNQMNHIRSSLVDCVVYSDVRVFWGGLSSMTSTNLTYSLLRSHH